ncbi:MAG: DUF1579 family protein [Planctomycetota bacterium]|jgi:hypothetical protein
MGDWLPTVVFMCTVEIGCLAAQAQSGSGPGGGAPGSTTQPAASQPSVCEAEVLGRLVGAWHVTGTIWAAPGVGAVSVVGTEEVRESVGGVTLVREFTTPLGACLPQRMATVAWNAAGIAYEMYWVVEDIGYEPVLLVGETDGDEPRVWTWVPPDARADPAQAPLRIVEVFESPDDRKMTVYRAEAEQEPVKSAEFAFSRLIKPYVHRASVQEVFRALHAVGEKERRRRITNLYLGRWVPEAGWEAVVVDRLPSVKGPGVWKVVLSAGGPANLTIFTKQNASGLKPGDRVLVAGQIVGLTYEGPDGWVSVKLATATFRRAKR